MTTVPTFSAGQMIVVMMWATKETAPFQISEVSEYQGITIVYGEALAHGVVIQPGKEEVTGRESVFLFVPNGIGRQISQFCEEIRSRQIGMFFEEEVSLINVAQTAVPQDARYYPVINGPLPSWFGPEILMDYSLGAGRARPFAGQKDKLLNLAREMVDLFRTWQVKEELPPWAILQRDIWLTRSN